MFGMEEIRIFKGDSGASRDDGRKLCEWNVQADNKESPRGKTSALLNVAEESDRPRTEDRPLA